MGPATAKAIADCIGAVREARRKLDFEAIEVLAQEFIEDLYEVDKMCRVSYSVYYVGEGWDLGCTRDYVRYFVRRADATQFAADIRDRYEEPEGAYLEGYPVVKRLTYSELNRLRDLIIMSIVESDNPFDKADIILTAL